MTFNSQEDVALNKKKQYSETVNASVVYCGFFKVINIENFIT